MTSVSAVASSSYTNFSIFVKKKKRKNDGKNTQNDRKQRFKSEAYNYNKKYFIKDFCLLIRVSVS